MTGSNMQPDSQAQVGILKVFNALQELQLSAYMLQLRHMEEHCKQLILFTSLQNPY